MNANQPARRPIAAIQNAFSRGRPALMPYFTVGYPDLDTSLDIVQACADAGADLFELGVPFSDPLADGPTIQHSSQTALENGITVGSCLQAVSALRQRGVQTPMVLMSYYNPLYAYGVAKFVQHAAESGANGFIVPDLPPEEAGPLQEQAARHGLAVIFLISPNSPASRVQAVCEQSTGFTYLVSVTGITGAREELPDDLTDFIARVRESARTPLAVGFGISTPAQAQAVARVADGVIVGSALIKAVEQALAAGRSPAASAGDFVAALRAAL